jgi:[acyl-carrier-protein] S-malonyltransferase
VLAFDLKRVCFESSPLELNRITNLLPAILTTSVALFRIYMEELGTPPMALAGHRLGEFSALTCAGAMSFPTALQIVRKRSELAGALAKSENATMSIVENLSPDDGATVCRELSRPGHVVSVSCINAADQFALSGHEAAVMEAEKACQQRGARTTPMLSSPPFHCDIMAGLAEKLREDLLQCELTTPKWPVLANCDAAPHGDRDSIIAKLTSQLVRPVQWHATLLAMRQGGAEVAIEIGAQSTLSQFVDKVGGFESFSFIRARDRELLQTMLRPPSPAAAAKAPERPKGSLELLRRCLGILASTPNKNPKKEEHEAGVLRPLAELQRTYADCKGANREPAAGEIRSFLNSAGRILDCKQVDRKTQVALFERLLDVTETRGLLSDFIREKRESAN